MLIKEVTINIPIKIDLDSKGDPKVSVADKDAEELDQNPVMMNPQQQELELKKAELGKQSPSIEKMVEPDEEGEEEESEDEGLDNIKALAGLAR